MAVFSSKSLLWARIFVLSLTAFKLLTDPQAVLEYTGVVVLGSAMDLPLLVYNEHTQIYGSIGVVITGYILCDLGSLLDGNVVYFDTAVFLRLCWFFGMCIYCYFGDYVPVCNSAVFAFCFLETWFGILTYSTLREEKYKRQEEVSKKLQEMKSRYDRGEMDEGEAAQYERMMDEAEYEKIMKEFEEDKPQSKPQPQPQPESEAADGAQSAETTTTPSSSPKKRKSRAKKSRA